MQEQESPMLQEVPVKVYRTGDRLTIASPMPGMEPEDIQVEVTDQGHVILQGQVRGLLKGVKELLIDEWTVGDYYRDVPLPDAVDGEDAGGAGGKDAARYQAGRDVGAQEDVVEFEHTAQRDQEDKPPNRAGERQAVQAGRD